MSGVIADASGLGLTCSLAAVPDARSFIWHPSSVTHWPHHHHSLHHVGCPRVPATTIPGIPRGIDVGQYFLASLLWASHGAIPLQSRASINRGLPERSSHTADSMAKRPQLAGRQVGSGLSWLCPGESVSPAPAPFWKLTFVLSIYSSTRGLLSSREKGDL